MKLKISELKPNPFKKEINGGKLNEENLSKLIESVEHGTLPEIFTVRKDNEKYELCFGHHRIEALKRVKGKNYEVIIEVVKRTDEQMIVDMARENLAQRSDDFREEMATVKFVRKYLLKNLESNAPIRPSSYGGDRRSQEIGARQIAIFLSKDGKMISHSKVANLLKIDRSVSPKLIEMAETSKNQWDSKSKTSPSILGEIAQIKDHKVQELIVKEAQEKEIGHKVVREIVSAYYNAPEEIKEKVKKGIFDLADIEQETNRFNIETARNIKDKQLKVKSIKQTIDKQLNYLKYSLSDSKDNINQSFNYLSIISKYFKEMDDKQKDNLDVILEKYEDLFKKVSDLISKIRGMI